MALNPEEKAKRKRQRMLDKAREYQIGTYMQKFVAPLFQKMIRAEAAAQPEGRYAYVHDGLVGTKLRRRGECVCVTCGRVTAWDAGLGGMHTGHFLGSRAFSIVLEEDNVAPQCSRCNRYESGAPQRFRQWMLASRGQETIDRLEALKHTTRHFTREELVDMRIEYERRLKAAIEQMKVV